MAYDEQQADRVRRQLGRRKGVTERKMFGGLEARRLAFMLHGNMCCGVVDRLAVWVRQAAAFTRTLPPK